MSMPNVAIVILTFNSAHTIGERLDSLCALHYQRGNHRRGYSSTDATREIVQTQYPMVTPIANACNVGYAEGNNSGLRDAIERGASFALVLNDDVLVAPGDARWAP